MLLLAALLLLASSGENWPQWRGPMSVGVSSETGLPTTWSATENVLWKAPLAGLGTSTPIVWENRVYLTFQTGSGPLDRRGAEFENAPPARDASAEEDVAFFVEAFDRETGRPVWTRRLPAEGTLPSVHPKHNLASPSAVTDGALVYAWFGTGQLLALDLEGNLVWQKHLGKEYAPFDVLWGHGSSPVLYEDLLILQCDHPGRAYLVALDKKSGKERFKLERGTGLRSYSTPLVMKGSGGDELIVNGSGRLDAYDPRTGAPLWHAGEPTTLAIPMAVYEGDVIFASRGYSSGPYMALRSGGKVDWFFPTRAPYVSSLVYYQGVLYMATEMGVVTAIDPKTGETLFRKRLEGVFTASPVAADGKIYLLDENGDTFVLSAGRKLELLARNHLGERALASPAIAGGHLFIRTDRNLFCIGR